MSEIKGKKILILGFGREGKSVLNYLKNNYSDLEITLADKNEKAIDIEGFPLQTGTRYLDNLETFDTVIHSPAISPGLLKNAKYATTATNIFFELCSGITIGITGTKGKSTTSSLIYELIKAAGKDVRLVGNIGNSMLDQLENATKDTYFVIELSSYQLQDFRFSPHIAVVLPIYHEHLSYHGDFASYVAAKKHIIEFQTKKDFVVFHSKNEFSAQIAQSSQAQKIPYDAASFKKLIGQFTTNLKGLANLENVMAAVSVAQLLNIDRQVISSALKSFKPLPHRIELVGTYKDITFYNDSLATIPQATQHALEALGNKVTTLIAGGFDRGVDFANFGHQLAQSSLKQLILFPDTGVKIAAALKKADPKTTISISPVKTMEEAVKIAYQVTPKGGICLLSPAAASFNLFKDYADRGEQFKSWVEKLAH